MDDARGPMTFPIHKGARPENGVPATVAGRGAFARRQQSPAAITIGPNFFLYLFIGSMPLQAAPWLTGGLFDIPALRPTTILIVIAFLAFLWGVFEARRTDPLERKAVFYFGAYMVLFLIAFVRSIPNLPIFAQVDPESFSAKVSTYIDSYFVLNALGALSFIYVLMRMNSPRALSDMFTAIAVGITIQSCILIIVIAMDPAVLFTYERLGMAALTKSVFGMHYNDVGTSYVVTGPLMLYMAIRRKSYWIVAYALACVAVLLLESRTALEVFGATSLATLFAMQQRNILFMVVPFAMLLVLVAFGSLLASFLGIGFSNNAGFSFNELLTGREDSVWLPLLKEWWGNSLHFWIGAGEYSISASRSRLIGATMAVAQAHNAFIEFFLDNGIVATVVFVWTLAVFSYRGWTWGRSHNNQLYWTLFFCWIGFLIACMTGRRFFPLPENMLVFPMLAALLNVARLSIYRTLPRQRTSLSPAARNAASVARAQT